MSDDLSSDRSRVRRNAARGVYDRETIHAVLDSEKICHVAYIENGEPRVIPTAYIRVADDLYLHGNRQSAMLRAADGGDVAVAVTALDGLVAARSGFHCSLNYRSVILFGKGECVGGDQAEALLAAFVDKLIPGHGDAVRLPTAQELAATSVVRVPISDASAKIRTGGPIDPAEDLGLDIWAGDIPLETVVRDPIPSPDLAAGIAAPDYIKALDH